MPKPLLWISAMFAVLCLCVRPCSAQAVFTRDTIIDLIFDDVIARQDPSYYKPPTITVVKKGWVGNGIQAWDESIVNVTDGYVGLLFGKHHTRLNVTDGDLLSLEARD